MKIRIAVLSMISCFLCSTFLWAVTPELESGVKINDGSSPIEHGLCIVVNCVDWDNDGAKDLIIGDWSSGGAYIWLYLNQGTDLNPVFNGGTMIESSGIPIKMTAC